MSNNHENDLSAGRRYKKYEHQYNAAFAADPNPQNRRFDEMAPEDSIQWKRLEVYRGNDKDAYDAYRSNANDALVRPTQKEQAMWDANAQDNWRVDRDSRNQAFSDHWLAYNKWLDMPPEQRFSERAQDWFAKAESKYAAGYEDWAQKAGSNVVDRKEYLEGLTAVAVEQTAAARTQQAQQAQALQPEQDANQQANVKQQGQERVQGQDPSVPRSRISLANFNVGAVAKEMESMSEEELGQVKRQAEAVHQAAGLGSVQEGISRHQAIAEHRQEQQQHRAHQMEPEQQEYKRTRIRQQ